MTITEFDNILESLPYFSKTNVSEELYNSFKKLRADVIAEAEDPESVFSKVSGIWYMPNLDFGEGLPQLFAKTSIPVNTSERGDFVLRLGQYADFDMVYDYNESIVKGDTMVQGTRSMLAKEIAKGRAFTIFDAGRDL